MGDDATAPVDVRSATWGGGWDWAFVVLIPCAVVGGLLVLASVVGGPVEAYPGLTSVLVVIGVLYLVGWWRARRLLPGLGPVRTQAAAGHLDVVVRSSRGLGAVLFSWRTGTLTVRGGWVVLEGSTPEAWPVGAVSLGRPSSWWSGRAVELVTPSGPRNVSLVPAWDPAVYFATVVDRPGRELVADVLARQQRLHPGPPPGWHPDPARSSAWQWWDGTTWTGATA